MNFLHSRQHFDFAGIEIMGNTDAAEHGLTRSGGAVDFKAEMNQLIDHLLDLIFTGRILHCDDHECARFARPWRAGNCIAAWLKVLVLELRIHLGLAGGRFVGSDFVLLNAPHHIDNSFINLREIAFD